MFRRHATTQNIKMDKITTEETKKRKKKETDTYKRDTKQAQRDTYDHKQMHKILDQIIICLTASALCVSSFGVKSCSFRSSDCQALPFRGLLKLEG